jgi:hypothetical protein
MFIYKNPHLNTIYRMLMILTLTKFIQYLTQIVTRKPPLASQFSEKHAIEFLGDLMECGFRNVPDPRQNPKILVQKFLKQWKFEDANVVASTVTSIQQFCEAVDAVVKLEAPFYF